MFSSGSSQPASPSRATGGRHAHGGYLLEGRRDAVIYQALAWSDLSPDRIKVLRGDSQDILTSVLAARKAVGTRTALEQPRKGVVTAKRTA